MNYDFMCEVDSVIFDCLTEIAEVKTTGFNYPDMTQTISFFTNIGIKPKLIKVINNGELNIEYFYNGNDWISKRGENGSLGCFARRQKKA